MNIHTAGKFVVLCILLVIVVVRVYGVHTEFASSSVCEEYPAYEEELVVEVVDTPRIKKDSVSIKADILSPKLCDEQQTAFSFFSTRYDDVPTITVGDILVIRATIEKPMPFETENGKIFPYDKYVQHNNAHLVGYFAEYISFNGVSVDTTLRILRVFANIKHYFVSSITSSLQQPEASFIAGILVGGRGVISAELEDIFRKTGLSHIVVLSGFNVAIVISVVIFLLQLCNRVLNRISIAILALIMVTLFILVVGPSAPLVRAAIMSALTLIAWVSYRDHNSIYTLLCTAWVMVVITPSILLYDVSFHLSFLATLGIVVLLPFWIRAKPTIHTWVYYVFSIIFMTLSAQLFVMPYIWYAFGTISLTGILANIVVVPIIPMAMLAGVCILIPVIRYIGIVVAYALAHYTIVIATFLSTLAISQVIPPSITIVGMSALYGIIGVIVYAMHHSLPPLSQVPSQQNPNQQL